MIIFAPISVGELYDKITILQVKSERLTDQAKLANVFRELEDLRRISAEKVEDNLPLDRSELNDLISKLHAINAELWDIEDGKRAAEELKKFDQEFICLARKVYIKNDLRAAIKRKINILTGSTIIEEKNHKGASS